MTIRSLFNIVLKIFGLYLFLTFLMMLSQIIYALVEIFIMKILFWEAVIPPLLVGLVYGIGAFLLMFKTDFLIKIFRLEKGFDQEIIPLNIHRSTVMSIAVIIIGGWLLVNETPELVRHAIEYYLEKKKAAGDVSSRTTIDIVVSVVKVIIGFFMTSGQRQIVNLIEKRRKDSHGSSEAA
jgi:hypothetical protein